MLSNGGNTMTVDTKELVTTIAYLIGVKKHIIEQCFDAECHDTLQKLYAHKGATIIRYLCKLRTTLFQKFKKTDTEMRYNLTAASLRSAFRRHGEVNPVRTAIQFSKNKKGAVA